VSLIRQHSQFIIIVLLGFLISACAAPETKVVDVQLPVFPKPPEEARFYYDRSLFSSADVGKASEEMDLKMMLTGASDQAALSFAKPFSVAVHKGRIFVSDTVRRSVMAFDFPERKSFIIGKSEPGFLAKPLGLDTDANGNLYVVDITLKRVTIYDRDGVFIGVLGGKDLLDRPSGIAVLPDGSKVFVVDTGGVSSNRHRVSVFDPKTGEHLYSFGSRGSGDGQFNLPREAEIGPDGRLYVVDGGNFRVQVFEQDGTFVRSFGQIGRQLGQFSRPKGITLDPDGNVYVADAGFGNFQIFTPEGQLLMYIGRRGSENSPAVYMLPAGIDVDEDGRIYFVDQYFRRVDIFRPADLLPQEGYLGLKQSKQVKSVAE